MSRTTTATPRREVTPVDDVRRIRERLSKQAGNDVRRLIEQSKLASVDYRVRFGLRSASSARSARR